MPDLLLIKNLQGEKMTMLQLENIVSELNKEFDIELFGADSAFSRFLPSVYEQMKFDWKAVFEEEFTRLFNGLMIRGASEVKQIHMAVFPTDHVLERFLATSQKGDLLFMHHPLLMECGDPRGRWGKGFVPIKETYIEQMKQKDLSVYSCHVPMDYHRDLGTSAAIAKQLQMEVVDGFLPSDHNQNDLILIGHIEKTSTSQLMSKLETIFDIPYVDFEGKKLDNIEKVAIVAGCGDKVAWMKEAESKGVQAYITGEVHCHIDNDYGRGKYDQMKEYAATASMSLIGVSHSASEYLVKKTLMKDWFQQKFGIEPALIPQETWWL
jgi:putative NIF3 family GTP cyclohydrolase 1 type 2